MSRPKEICVIAEIKLRRDRFDWARDLAGLDTEQKLANAMGASQGTVNKVLNGRQKPSPEFMASLVKALKARAFEDLWEIVVSASDSEVAA